MLDEISALMNYVTWKLVSLPFGKCVLSYWWTFAIKVGLHDTIDRLKARLVAKCYTQIFLLDYVDTFSQVVKMTFDRLFIVMGALQHWPLYQLNVQNVFLNDDLREEINIWTTSKFCC